MNNIPSIREENQSPYSPVKKEWVKPSLQELDISETNGGPGFAETDGGDSPYSSIPKS